MEWLTSFSLPEWRGLLEIAVLALCFYFLLDLFRETPSAQIVSGLILLLAILIGLTQVFRLDALNWLLRRISVYLAVALLVIFQPEIRRALLELGKQHVFGSSDEPRTILDNIIQAVMLLAEQRVGALIAIEREISTKAVQETGIEVDSRVVPELLAGIFHPNTPLHDGGVIIRGSRIVAAGCLFPLSQRSELSKGLGTRHRAALGLTEETDAIVVVVSEESGAVSVSYRGKLIRGLDEERLRRFMSATLLATPTIRSRWHRTRDQINTTLRGAVRTRPANEDTSHVGQ
jgi:diadenylate cyclase